MTRKENILLRYCCRLQVSDEAMLRITELLGQGVDWDYFLSLAKNENVAALLHRVFSHIEHLQDTIPVKVKNGLQDAYYTTLSRNLIILRSLEEIAAMLAKEKIEIILFKGLMLAELVYQDIGVKPMADIDLLVKRADLAKLDKILKKIGYAPLPGAEVLLTIAFNRHRNSIDYSKPSAITLHVYWHIINYITYDTEIIKKIDMEKIWGESTAIKVGEASLRTFSNHHQVLYLCLHSLIHCFQPLLLGCDLHEFIRLEKKKIDWDRVIKEAMNLGVSKYIYYGLFFIQRLFDADIPSVVLNSLEPKKVSYFEKKFVSSVLGNKPLRWTEEFLSFGMTDSLLGRVSFICKTVFPSREEMAAIRQKKISEVNGFDYLRRFSQAVSSSLSLIHK